MRITAKDVDISNINDRINRGIYDLQPDFQRDIVWNIEKQQKLIDSIMRGWHIPPVHLVKIEGKEKFEVLDGKQRLFSIHDFLNDKFVFNSSFMPENGDFKNLNRKKFSQLPEEIKDFVLYSPIRILEVSDVKMYEATELFLRLNLGVNVSSSEKRNCIYGPVKEFLRDILGEYPKLFCVNTLGFSNSRMAYQDVLDRIYFLEQKGCLEYRPNSKALEKMYFEKKVDGAVISNIKINLSLTENVLYDFYEKHNYKLTKSILMSYYWFIRDISLNNLNRFTNSDMLTTFLVKFEEWRKIQKKQYENDEKVSNRYVEFETFLSEGWLDPQSLKGRHKILIDFYHEFIESDKFGELND